MALLTVLNDRSYPSGRILWVPGFCSIDVGAPTDPSRLPVNTFLYGLVTYQFAAYYRASKRTRQRWIHRDSYPAPAFNDRPVVRSVRYRSTSIQLWRAILGIWCFSCSSWIHSTVSCELFHRAVYTVWYYTYVASSTSVSQGTHVECISALQTMIIRQLLQVTDHSPFSIWS